MMRIRTQATLTKFSNQYTGEIVYADLEDSKNVDGTWFVKILQDDGRVNWINQSALKKEKVDK